MRYEKRSKALGPNGFWRGLAHALRNSNIVEEFGAAFSVACEQCQLGVNRVTGSEQFHSITVSARAISALQDVPRRRFVGSGRQACREEASFVAPAVDFALVVLGGEVDGHRKFRLALQDL